MASLVCAINIINIDICMPLLFVLGSENAVSLVDDALLPLLFFLFFILPALIVVVLIFHFFFMLCCRFLYPAVLSTLIFCHKPSDRSQALSIDYPGCYLVDLSTKRHIYNYFPLIIWAATSLTGRQIATFTIIFHQLSGPLPCQLVGNIYNYWSVFY
jgi:hypothetical protein